MGELTQNWRDEGVPSRNAAVLLTKIVSTNTPTADRDNLFINLSSCPTDPATVIPANMSTSSAAGRGKRKAIYIMLGHLQMGNKWTVRTMEATIKRSKASMLISEALPFLRILLGDDMDAQSNPILKGGADSMC